MLNRLFKEIIVSFLLGGLPLIIAFALGGVDLLERTLGSLIPSSLLFCYAIALSAAAAAITWPNWAWLSGTPDVVSSTSFLKRVATEMLPAGLSVLRIAAGLLITFTVLWATADAKTFDSGTAIKFLFFGVACLAVVTALPAAIRWLQPQTTSAP